jgi:hypothetical protein
MSRQINIDGIENKINTLSQIEKWDEKLNMIKQIKADIKKENENIDNLVLSLDRPLTKTKEYSIDKILSDFDKVDLSKKIKYYQNLNSYIKGIEDELFN